MRRGANSFLGGLLLLLALVACSTSDQPTQAPGPPTPEETRTVEPPAAPTPTAVPSRVFTATAQPVETATRPAATPTLPTGYFRNPVLNHDFPDPDSLKVGSVYYAYATNYEGVNIQTARSEDLMTWEYLGDALPDLPDWAVQDFGWAWAPDVTVQADGSGFLMYYTARFKIENGGVQCIGVAVSDTPEGPFQLVESMSPEEDQPLICQTGEGGSIDPASFVDEDGTAYLLWKNDGNSMGGISYIYIQRLGPDGLSLDGEPARLIRADQIWEGVLVEGPTLWKHEGKYYLFYSANDYASPRYAAGYAVSENIFGPYTKAPEPVLETTLKAGIVGPGGQDIVVDEEGQTWMLFHSWSAEGARHMNLARLEWQDGKPLVSALSREPQPGPEEETP